MKLALSANREFVRSFTRAGGPRVGSSDVPTETGRLAVFAWSKNCGGVDTRVVRSFGAVPTEFTG